MSGSAVLQTALGLALTFGVLALLCSGVCEYFASLLQSRPRFLLTGLRLMLDHPADEPVPTRSTTALARRVTDPATTTSAYQAVNALAEGDTEARPEVAGTGLTMAIFGHPLVQSTQIRLPRRPLVTLGRRLVGQPTGNVRNPAYLSAQIFSHVLLDTLVPDRDGIISMDAVTGTINGLPDSLPAKKSLQTLVKRSEGDLTTLEREIEGWYDDQMARVSGWYKRWAKRVLAITGLVIAIGANIDSLQLAHDLYLEQPLRQAVITQADTGTLCQGRSTPQQQASCADRELGRVGASGLPVWWPHKCLTGDVARCFRYDDTGSTGVWNVVGKLAGWGLTAFAVSFGAPFWFQALSRLGSLRSAGPRPPGTAPA
jgi:hypothetical protein